MSVNKSTAAGVGTGATAGALSGAGAGTAVVPGIGTAIGAAIGAIAGGISGGMKAHADAENREEEVKRVQQREDTAQQRAVYDAFMAGVDNRVNGDISPAGSASVAPQEIPETTSDIVSGLGAAQKAFQDRVSMDMQAQQIVGDNYQKFVINADNQLNASIQERDRLMVDMAERYNISKEDVQRNYEETQDALRTLNEKIKESKHSDVYKTLSSKIDINSKDKFNNFTDSDWHELYDNYKVNVNGGATLSFDEFKIQLSAAYENAWGKSQKQGREHSYGSSEHEGDNVTSTTSYDDITETLGRAMHSVCSETIWKSGTDSLFKNSSSASSISKEDKEQYIRSMKLLTTRISFFANQRSTDYMQYVYQFYPNLRKYLHTMRYGLINEFSAEQFDYAIYSYDYLQSNDSGIGDRIPPFKYKKYDSDAYGIGYKFIPAKLK